MSWRDIARRSVAAVIEQHPELADPTTPRLMRVRIFRPAYPFGERRYWPYKVWIDEIAIQTGRRDPRTRRGVNRPDQARLEACGQMRLMEGNHAREADVPTL